MLKLQLVCFSKVFAPLMSWKSYYLFTRLLTISELLGTLTTYCFRKAFDIYKKLIILVYVKNIVIYWVVLSTCYCFIENDVYEVPLTEINLWISFLFFMLIACSLSLLIRFCFYIRILLKARNVSTLNRPIKTCHAMQLISKISVKLKTAF